MPDDLSRRGFLQSSAAGLALAQSAQGGAQPEAPRPGPRAMPPGRQGQPKRRLAVVTTTYYYLSHAYHICGRFLHGYLRDGSMHYPDFGIVGMHVEQTGAGDLSASLAKTPGFTLYPNVADALTLGGSRLAVDGVLLIGEHGDYPTNRKGQKLY